MKLKLIEKRDLAARGQIGTKYSVERDIIVWNFDEQEADWNPS
jgi:hypothetical protein